MKGLLLLLIAASVYAQSSSADRVIKADARVRDVTFSSSGETLAAFSADGKVLIWDVSSGKLLRTVTLDDQARMPAFAPGGNVFATGGQNGLRVWDLKTGKTNRELPAPAVRQIPLAFSRDAAVLAVGGRDKMLRVFDVASGRERAAIRGGLGGPSAAAFSPDNAALVAADNDTNIRVWSTRNGELLRLIEDLPVTTFSLAFSPDGKYLASGGVDGVLYLWDAHTWKLLRKMPGQPEMISSVAFSPDGRLLATGGFSDISSSTPVTVLLRDVASGKVVRSIPSPNRISGTVFSPDGKWIATTNLDMSIGLWNVPGAAQR